MKNRRRIRSAFCDLPAGLPDARKLAFICELAETDAAEMKVPHIAALAAAPKAAPHYT